MPTTGNVFVEVKTVRYVRPGLVEEYSVSMDGVRQDSVVQKKPVSHGELRVELAVTGAMVEQTASNVQLLLEKSGRKIAYSRLRVTDATGKKLSARMEVVDARVPASLAVMVNDTEAVYPVRIDPTFSDANWISLGGYPGVEGLLQAAAADESGNLYVASANAGLGICGDVGGPGSIAKWDGSRWSKIGTNWFYGTLALAVSGSDVYIGGQFSVVDGVDYKGIAKWNGTNWIPVGGGFLNRFGGSGSVYTLKFLGTNLYAGGNFEQAGASLPDTSQNGMEPHGVRWEL